MILIETHDIQEVAEAAAIVTECRECSPALRFGLIVFLVIFVNIFTTIFLLVIMTIFIFTMFIVQLPTDGGCSSAVSAVKRHLRRGTHQCEGRTLKVILIVNFIKLIITEEPPV